MTEPNSLEAMHGQCCADLESLASPESHGPTRIRGIGGVVGWVVLLAPYAPLVWQLASVFINYLIFIRPVRRKLDTVQEAIARQAEAADRDLEALRARLDALQETLNQGLREMREKHTTELPPELGVTIDELKGLLARAHSELNGKVSPEMLTVATQHVAGQLMSQPVPGPDAEEVAEIIKKNVGKPLLVPAGWQPLSR
jgi:hypothetical protein